MLLLQILITFQSTKRVILRNFQHLDSVVVFLVVTLRNRMLLRSESEYQELKLRPTSEFMLLQTLLKYCNLCFSEQQMTRHKCYYCNTLCESP